MRAKAKVADGKLRLKTAGYSVTDRLSVDVTPSQCGAITDGVVFRHDDQRGWVLAYADLVKITEAARKKRAQIAGSVNDH